jgi:hypothetical protein
MTNTVFPTFQTQSILDFSSVSYSEHWDLPRFSMQSMYTVDAASVRG